MSVKEAFNYEEKAIEELQMRVENCLTPAMRDDETLYYRFLKARGFDVDKAEKMLRKHITWRKVNQIDTICEDFKPMECFLNYIDARVFGYDRKGNLLRYWGGGKMDPVNLLNCMTFNHSMKHWMWAYESSFPASKEERIKSGRNALRGVAIVDMDKLPFSIATSKAAVDLVLRAFIIFQDNYPERLEAAYIINAPSYFVIAFTLLKPTLSALLWKIQIFGYSGWKEKLLDVIDADVLPAFLGGNRTDPDGDPMCRTFITLGGRIPESYFVSEKDRCFKDAVEVKKVIIQPSEKEQIRVELKEVGSLLQWEFLVKGKDIGFGIFYEGSNSNVTDVIPIHKCGTPDGTEKDSYKCRTSGKYIVVFDNSYSWISSKEVQYCITVVKPNY